MHCNEQIFSVLRIIREGLARPMFGHKINFKDLDALFGDSDILSITKKSITNQDVLHRVGHMCIYMYC